MDLLGRTAPWQRRPFCPVMHMHELVYLAAKLLLITAARTSTPGDEWPRQSWATLAADHLAFAPGRGNRWAQQTAARTRVGIAERFDKLAPFAPKHPAV